MCICELVFRTVLVIVYQFDFNTQVDLGSLATKIEREREKEKEAKGSGHNWIFVLLAVVATFGHDRGKGYSIQQEEREREGEKGKNLLFSYSFNMHKGSRESKWNQESANCVKTWSERWTHSEKREMKDEGWRMIMVKRKWRRSKISISKRNQFYLLFLPLMKQVIT